MEFCFFRDLKLLRVGGDVVRGFPGGRSGALIYRGLNVFASRSASPAVPKRPSALVIQEQTECSVHPVRGCPTRRRTDCQHTLKEPADEAGVGCAQCVCQDCEFAGKFAIPRLTEPGRAPGGCRWSGNASQQPAKCQPVMVRSWLLCQYGQGQATAEKKIITERCESRPESREAACVSNDFALVTVGQGTGEFIEHRQSRVEDESNTWVFLRECDEQILNHLASGCVEFLPARTSEAGFRVPVATSWRDRQPSCVRERQCTIPDAKFIDVAEKNSKVHGGRNSNTVRGQQGAGDNQGYPVSSIGEIRCPRIGGRDSKCPRCTVHQGQDRTRNQIDLQQHWRVLPSLESVQRWFGAEPIGLR